jgi:O-antigen/teichoic acid export membrane protein
VRNRSARAVLVGRAVWSATDQALSSLTNAALSIFLALVTSAEGFGYFAIAFTVYTFLLGTSKALVNQPYLMRWPGADERVARRAAAAGTGLALLTGVAFAAVLVPVGLFLVPGAGPSLAVMGALLPLLLVQDAWRAVFIARQRPRSAAANGLLWTFLQFAALSVAVAFGVRDPAPLIAVWALSGWIAAVVAVLQGRVAPAVASAMGYLRSTRYLSQVLVAEYVTVLGAAQIALLLIGTIGSAVDVGSIRGAQTLLGPLNILGIGAFSFLVPELARRRYLSARRFRLVALYTSAVLGAVNLAWGGVLVLLPDQVGRAVLGNTWSGARETMVALTMWSVGIALATGPIVVIRAQGRAKESFSVNVLLGVMQLVGPPIGLVLGGAPGAAWAFALGTLVTAPMFGLRMEKVLRHPTRAVGSP